jgi:hypothetical protein
MVEREACAEKACAFPVVKEGLCIFHLRDREEQGRPFVTVADDSRDRIAKLLKEGRTIRDIAGELTDVSKGTIGNVRKEIADELPEDCKCGRPNGHRGACAGAKRGKQASKALSKPKHNMHENMTSSANGLDAPLAALRAISAEFSRKLDAVNSAIRILEGK